MANKLEKLNRKIRNKRNKKRKKKEGKNKMIKKEFINSLSDFPTPKKPLRDALKLYRKFEKEDLIFLLFDTLYSESIQYIYYKHEINKILYRLLQNCFITKSKYEELKRKYILEEKIK